MEAALTVKRRATAGFSLIELLIGVAIAGVMAAMAIPITSTAMKGYRLTAAIGAATGAIQSTRYQAIMNGYPYQLTFTPSTLSYTVLCEPPGSATYINLVPAVTDIPIARLGDVTINQTVTFTFLANGTISGSPAMTFTISNGIVTEQIQVSGVGNVSVSP